jgi:hypothetical protein
LSQRLHPAIYLGLEEQADGGRISSKRSVSKGVDVEEGEV